MKKCLIVTIMSPFVVNLSNSPMTTQRTVIECNGESHVMIGHHLPHEPVDGLSQVFRELVQVCCCCLTVYFCLGWNPVSVYFCLGWSPVSLSVRIQSQSPTPSLVGVQSQSLGSNPVSVFRSESSLFRLVSLVFGFRFSSTLTLSGMTRISSRLTLSRVTGDCCGFVYRWYNSSDKKGREWYNSWPQHQQSFPCVVFSFDGKREEE